MAQARAIVALRVRLAVRAFRRGGRGARTAAIVAALFVVPVSAVAGIQVWALLAGAPPSALALRLEALAAVAWCVWLVGPVFSAGVGEGFDVSRLVVYPVRRPALVAGMLAGGLSDVMALVSLPAFVGAAIVLSRGGGGVLAVAALALVFLHVVLAGQVAITAVSGLASSRRVRDAIAGVAFVVGMSVWAFSMLRDRLASDDLDALAADFAQLAQLAGRILPWTPPGSAARAAAEASAGHAGAAFSYGALSLAWLVAGSALWLALVERITHNAGALFTAGARSRERAKRDAIGRAAPSRSAARERRETAGVRAGWYARLAASPSARLVATIWKLDRRTPHRRMALIQGIAMPAVLAALMLGDGEGAGSATLFAPAILATFCAMFLANNRLGYDGAALTTVMLSPVPRRRWLGAHATLLVSLSVLPAFGMLVALPFVASVAASATAAGGLLALAMAWITVDLGLLASVHAPVPVIPGSRPPMTQALVSTLALLAVPAVAFVVGAPAWGAVALSLLRPTPAVSVAAALVALAWGAGIHRVALARLARDFERREVEIAALLATAVESRR